MNIEEQLKLINFIDEAFYNNSKQKSNQLYQLKIKLSKWENTDCENDANYILWKAILGKLNHIDRLKNKKKKIKKPLEINGVIYTKNEN